MDHYCSALTLKITNIRYYDTVFDFMCSIFKHLFSLSLIQIISFKKFNYSFISNWLFYIIIWPYFNGVNSILAIRCHINDSSVVIGIQSTQSFSKLNTIHLFFIIIFKFNIEQYNIKRVPLEILVH